MGIHPRHHLDATPRNALFAFFSCLLPRRRPERSSQSLTCLTVRSAFDLTLQCSELQPGDEVLVSAITHPDMVRIIEMHGLVAVPVDIGKGTLCPTPADLEARRTSRTRAVLHAHLFGARSDLSAMSHYCRRHDLMLIEDCAQSITSAADRGHAGATVSLFSFGFIKTATAFGGAVAHVRDGELLERMQSAHSAWPTQTRSEYAAKALKALVAMGLARPNVYARLVHGKHDPGKFTRTIPTLDHGQFSLWLRRQPSAGLERTVHHRLRHFPARRLTARTAAGRTLLTELPEGLAHPCAEAESTHWLFPVLCADPATVSKQLDAAGFDAAPTTSQIRALGSAPHAQAIMDRLVFLPAYPELGERELARLAANLEANDKPTPVG